MEINKALDLMEKIESEAADLYQKLQNDYLYNKMAAEFFDHMHREKQSHHHIINMMRRVVKVSPGLFSEPNLNALEIHSLLEHIANLKADKLELPVLIGRIYAIESSAAMRYLLDATKESNESFREFLGTLSDSCERLRVEIESFAKRLGIEIGSIDNRHLRAARVGYADRVIINGQLSVRGMDLSEGGMFLLTGRTFSSGTTLSLQFSVLKTLVTVNAIVQFSIERVGMGMRFTNLPDKAKQIITNYVAQRIEGAMLEKERRILLVGSDRVSGRDMRIHINTLIEEGFKVVDISGFEDAISVLRKGLDLSCMIISIDSEQESNYYLLYFLRILERYQNLLIIAVTSNQNAAFQEKLVKQGVGRILVRVMTSPKRLLDEVKAATA